MKYAIFDIDGTLINKDSILIAAYFSNNKLQLIIRSIFFIPIFLASKLGLINTKLLKEKFLKIFNICDLFNNPKKYKNREAFRKIIKANIKVEALNRINFHKSLGDKVLLCSASPRMIIDSLSEYLEIDLICTELYIDENGWLPKIKGNNCNGIEKVRKIEIFIDEKDLKDFHVYGDSVGDRELLNKSNFPHWRSFTDELKKYPLLPLNQIIPFILIILFIYFTYIFNSHGLEIFPIISQLKFEISLGLILITIGYLIRFFRWRIFLRALNLNIPIKDDFITWMGSYAFTATPGKAGEGLRSVLLNERFDLPVDKTLASVLMERFSDGVSILLIMIINFSLLDNLNINFVNASIILGIICLILISLKRIKFLKKNPKMFFNNKFIKSIINALYFFNKLLNIKLILFTTLLGLLSWSFEGISFWILLRGFNFPNITYGDAAISHLGAGLIGAFSFLPGGVGTTEASTAGILMLKNIPLKEAMTSTIIIRLMTLWFATFLGIICLIIPFKKVN